ncbi:MAG: methylmalonyl Co-A mutase-associated GTPase MeaB [Myxococcota bacterium]
MAFELAQLVQSVLKRERAAIAEAISRVEDVRPRMLAGQRELIRRLEAETPAASSVVGLTGPPGVGKSTLAGALIQHCLEQGSGVGMVAVDPSSRRSGGALLGDRARLRFESTDRVFVRSMASREQLGGLAPATRAAVVVLRAAFPWTLVETVGVGQSEVDVETVADSVVLVLQPGSGDALQFMKAGILEIPDVLVIHKWDLGPPAQLTRAELESMLSLRTFPDPGWSPPVLGVSAQTGHGVPELAAEIGRHRAHLEESGELERRRRGQREAWVMELFERRYGSFGSERLGGREALRQLCAELEGTALDAFSQLSSRAGLEP